MVARSHMQAEMAPISMSAAASSIAAPAFTRRSIFQGLLDRARAAGVPRLRRACTVFGPRAESGGSAS